MSTVLDFAHADSVATHFGTLITPTLDPLIAAKYAGFVAVAAVCVYEMAIKDIFMNFATAKHPVLGVMTREAFDRINGKVRYQVIKDDYVPRFGEKYSTKFKKRVKLTSEAFLRSTGRDFITSYNNVIVWRNDFVHAARVPTTATFLEVVRSYEDGKEVLHCLNSAMAR